MKTSHRWFFSPDVGYRLPEMVQTFEHAPRYRMMNEYIGIIFDNIAKDQHGRWVKWKESTHLKTVGMIVYSSVRLACLILSGSESDMGVLTSFLKHQSVQAILNKHKALFQRAAVNFSQQQIPVDLLALNIELTEDWGRFLENIYKDLLLPNLFFVMKVHDRFNACLKYVENKCEFNSFRFGDGFLAFFG